MLALQARQPFPFSTTRWSLPGAFLEPSWSLPGAFLEPSWSLPGAFLEPSWSLPGAFLEPSWSLPGAFLEPSWSLPGAFLEPSPLATTCFEACLQGMLAGHACRACLPCKQAIFPSKPEILFCVKTEKNWTLHLFSSTKVNLSGLATFFFK